MVPWLPVDKTPPLPSLSLGKGKGRQGSPRGCDRDETGMRRVCDRNVGKEQQERGGGRGVCDKGVVGRVKKRLGKVV